MKGNNGINSLISEHQLQVVDLFCGCGGFSLGMERAGFRILAAIDFNAEAISTYRRNMPQVPHILERDLTRFTAQELTEIIGDSRVDVIVGGPPCQGYSTVRQRDGANHGQKRLIDDKRRYLYQEFLHYVEHFRPRVFVMENVLGIRSAAGGKYFTKVQEEARQLGYRVHSQIEDAWELGVPQKRRRQLIVGVRTELPRYFLPKLSPSPRATPHILLGAAIGDLPRLRAGSGEDDREYDLERRAQHLTDYDDNARKYLFQVLEIARATKLTNHVARPHSDRDLRDFALLREGENSATAMRERGVKFEFPYDKSSFKDRYTKQSRTAPCSTIVALLCAEHKSHSKELAHRI